MMAHFVCWLLVYSFCQLAASHDVGTIWVPAVNEKVPDDVDQDVGIIPWAVSIDNHCSGVLISSTQVLTSAQCHFETYSQRLFFGSRRPYAGSQMRMPNKQYVHQDFSSRTLINDIMLFEFDDPINITDTVFPIKLPAASELDEYESYEGVRAFISGWGMTNDSDNPSPTIQTVSVTVISNSLCAESKFGSFVQDTIICSYGENSTDNLCSGDAGSGLYFYDEDNQPTLIGIGSFINIAGCDIFNSTSGFTRITPYLNWVKNSVPPAVNFSYTLIVTCVLTIGIFKAETLFS